MILSEGGLAAYSINKYILVIFYNIIVIKVIDLQLGTNATVIQINYPRIIFSKLLKNN